MQHVRSVILSAALALTPALSHAQLPVNTGAQTSGGRDTRWQLAYGSNVGSDAGILGAFSNAFIITNPPWATRPADASWIGASANGFVPFGQGNGRPSFIYAARTQFTLNTGDQLTYKFQCQLDNFWVGLFVNGTQQGGLACGPDASLVLGAEYTVGPSSFMAGLNTVEFRWTGDGVTDGLLISSTTASLVPGNPGTPGVVPEPSTYALMATGLAGLFGVARRRKQQA